MKKAYGYIRVSSKSQVKGDGFKIQEKAIRDYAEKNGYKIIQIFREKGITGTAKARPALAEMMVSLEKNGLAIETVIVEKLDRLARDIMVQEAIIRDFKNNGFKLISALEGSDLLSDDPSRKLIRQVLGAIAEYDKDMTVLKLRVARERLRAAGKKVEGRKSYKEIAPETIELIRKLRRKPKPQKGEKTKRRTFKQVAQELNAQGFTTMTGKPFTSSNIRMLLHRL